jgi:cyclic pyranopterin phosphate synthase
MPSDEKNQHHRTDILTSDELINIASEAVACGIKKIRITGGEPLMRSDISDICRGISGIPGLQELCLTTNGSMLPRYAKELREAGVLRLNISLNTLNAAKYKRITRCGELSAVLAGIRAAQEAGFVNFKMNTVLMGGINDDEISDFVALTKEQPIEVRFIELMPMGECSAWDKSCFISADTVLKACPLLEPIPGSGVARHYRVPGYMGVVGLISPISSSFCDDCSRIRITADGMLKPCLHSNEEIPLRGLNGDNLRTVIKESILKKPQRHHIDYGCSDTCRSMNEIGG